jgi:hypothetical protein
MNLSLFIHNTKKEPAEPNPSKVLFRAAFSSVKYTAVLLQAFFASFICSFRFKYSTSLSFTSWISAINISAESWGRGRMLFDQNVFIFFSEGSGGFTSSFCDFGLMPA